MRYEVLFRHMAALSALVLMMTGATWWSTVREAPVVRVRWTAAVETSAREAAAKQYALVSYGVAEGTTHTYLALRANPVTLVALITDPRVEDTAYVDRGTGIVEPGGPAARVWLGDEHPVAGGLLVAGAVLSLLSLVALAALRWGKPAVALVRRIALPRGYLALPLGTAVFAAAFAFRFLTPEFEMEQFVRLVEARQILQGELPDRDFLNRGFTGMAYASALAMMLFGDGLLGDLILTSGFISLGAALAWYLSLQASGSVLIAGVATLFAVAYFPALYNYPKIFLPVLGLVVIWRYLDVRTAGRLLAVCATVAVAIFFRHDHGLYLGVAVFAALVCAHLPTEISLFVRRVGLVLVGVLALGSPYLTSLIVNGRLVAHLQTSRTQGQALVDGMTVSRIPFSVDRSLPLVAPLISVRWTTRLTDEARHAKETMHRLSHGTLIEGRWRYVLSDRSPERVLALARDQDVDDTHGIYRSRTQQLFVPLSVAPGLLTATNAAAWLYYATVSLPPLCLLTLAMKRLGVWPWAPALPNEASKIFVAAVYGIVLQQALIRGALDSRLADVSTTTAVLAAWIMGQVFAHGPARTARDRMQVVLRAGGRSWRTALSALLPASATAMAAIVVGLTIWSASTFGKVDSRIERGGLTALAPAPTDLLQRAHAVVADLSSASLDWWAPEGSVGLRALTRYVAACTRQDDRLMVTWLEPRPYFFSGRSFAGGMFVFHQGWLSSDDDQRLTVDRLGLQQVPIVIASVESIRSFEDRYRIVSRYINDRYVQAAESEFGERGSTYRVLVDKSRVPSGFYAPLALPCYS